MRPRQIRASVDSRSGLMSSSPCLLRTPVPLLCLFALLSEIGRTACSRSGTFVASEFTCGKQTRMSILSARHILRLAAACTGKPCRPRIRTHFAGLIQPCHRILLVRAKFLLNALESLFYQIVVILLSVDATGPRIFIGRLFRCGHGGSQGSCAANIRALCVAGSVPCRTWVLRRPPTEIIRPRDAFLAAWFCQTAPPQS